MSLRNHANESITADEPKHRTFYKTGKAEAFDKAIFLIDSLQQEQSIDSDILHDKLVDFLIKNDISEEKAKFLANQIADIYGSQRYIDGLCDGLKQEQPKIDIEKTVEEYLLNNHEFLIKHDSKTVVQALARYFYELGLNTGKED